MSKTTSKTTSKANEIDTGDDWRSWTPVFVIAQRQTFDGFAKQLGLWAVRPNAYISQGFYVQPDRQRVFYWLNREEQAHGVPSFMLATWGPITEEQRRLLYRLQRDPRCVGSSHLYELERIDQLFEDLAALLPEAKPEDKEEEGGDDQ